MDGTIEVTVEHIQDLEGNEQESAPHAKQALQSKTVQCAGSHGYLKKKRFLKEKEIRGKGTSAGFLHKMY